MRRTSLTLVGVGTLGLMFGLMLLPVLAKALATPIAGTQREPQIETFFGTVLKNGQGFVLSDSATKTRYALDDAQKVSRYEGATVKVTGTFDTDKNLIHVETIQPIMSR